MKVLIVECSPKRRGSNSHYFSQVFRLGLARAHSVRMKLTGTKDFPEILARLHEIDALVLAMPVYVDAVPCQVLRFFEEAEQYCTAHALSFRVYAISNCGFYEGKQCAGELAVVRCWCHRAGLHWSGGVGIGAGEMLGFIRWVPFVSLSLSGLRAVVMMFRGGFVFADALVRAGISLSVTLLVFLVFSMGMLNALWRMAGKVQAGRQQNNRFYGLALCPRIVFIFFADLFWIFRALFKGVPPWRLFQKP